MDAGAIVYTLGQQNAGINRDNSRRMFLYHTGQFAEQVGSHKMPVFCKWSGFEICI